MAERVSPASAGIVGREAELATLDDALAGLAAPRCVLLVGEPGIGKTTLWEAGVARGRRHAVRVLAARSSGAETRLAFAGLVDLLDEIDTEELDGVPPPQLRALAVALYRAEPTAAPPESHAIALGLLNALRSLAARGPVLVAIDDTQWLDPPSEQALAFAARRLEREPVLFLLARRPGPLSPLEEALAGHTIDRLELRPQSVGAMRQLLSERLGLTLPRPVLRRLHATTLGNPLFALELGRTLAARGGASALDDLPVPEAVDDLLGTRVAQLADPARRLLLALALDADLRASQLEAISEPGALADALAAGVVVLDADRVRPSHPLVAAAAKGRAPAGEQRRLHLALAEVVADDERRALHLALAADGADDELAALVAAAAARSAARGGTQQAVLLAEHALRLTTPGSPHRDERLLGLAGYLKIAGEKARVTELLAPELDRLPAGAPRVTASLLLAGGTVTDNDDIRGHFERALRESGDDARLRAGALARLAENEAAVRVERIGEAERWAAEALAAAHDDPQLERVALYALGWARSLGGRPIDDVCERFRAASEDASYLAESPERVAGQRLVWRGEIQRARAALGHMLVLADERGEPSSYALQRLHLCELELRAGNWPAASQLLDEWAESAEGDLLHWPMYERCRALLAVGRGDPAETERWAAEAIARAEVTGVRWDLLEAARARGVAATLAGRPEQAAELLRGVWRHTEREGVQDPGAFPAAPELVEALVELDEPDEAQAVTERLRDLALRQEHPWGLVTERRCAGLVALSERYDDASAAVLDQAAVDYGALELRFDEARTLLALGRAQRRGRKWGAARETLELAASTFETIGSPGWAEAAHADLGRLAPRRPAHAGELTPTERRVAELAAEGLANKEIAQALFVTVSTVEFHLSNAYAKLGIRSRAQLGKSLAALERT